MSHNQHIVDELERILCDVLDDKVTDAEFSSLVESLRNSEELRERACRFLCNEMLLVEEIGTTQQASELAELVSFEKPTPAAGIARAQRKERSSFGFRILDMVNSHGLAVAAVACTVVVFLIAYNMVMMAQLSRLHTLVVQGASQGEVEVVARDKEGSSKDTIESDTPGEQQYVVGRVIGASEVAMDSQEAPLLIGDTVREGQRIRLASGILELLLSTGAKLTLEGPVDLELPSTLKMELELGRVVAAVPRTARGYTIVTPTSELVDIGTQFGVSVEDSGETELHVFDGDVVARSRAETSSADLIHAKENEALRFGSAASEPLRFLARETDFVRRLGPTPSAEDLPPLPLTEKLSLWLSADTIFNAKKGDSISVWRDVLVGDNQYSNDARQLEAGCCPTYILDQQERPAVQFNGWSTSLIVDPMEYTGVYTIFVACTPAPTHFADGIHGGMLFKHGKSPSLELSVLGDKKVQGLVWPGRDQENVGLLRSGDVMPSSRISVAAYQYDSVNSRARMWLNGVLQGETDAPVELRQTALAYLGRHYESDVRAYFCGTLYEVLVYDDCLEDDSMGRLHDYFVKRYGLEPSP